MSEISDSIKQFIADFMFTRHSKIYEPEVEKFFQETIKSEKLSKKAQEHKQLILDKLTKLYEENPYLKVSTQDGKGKDNQDESLFTGGSTKSDGSEEAAYVDYGIPPTPASELKDAAFAGTLEKKQKKGSGLFGGAKFQTRWCVIHGGNFYYYVRADDKKQCGCFKLYGYKFRNNPDITKQKKDKELAFELYGDDKSLRVYQFVANNKADYETVQTVIQCGGVLMEDEVYEQVGSEEPPLPDQEEYVEDVGVTVTAVEPDEPGEVYEDPDTPLPPPPPEPAAPAVPPPPSPRGPSVKSTSALPPLPPTPAPPKHADTLLPEPPLEEDELYEEASSVLPPEKSTDEAPPPPPPPSRGALPQPPQMPIPEPPTRRLPPTPVEPPKKKKIKLSITCKPEEDFENMFFGKWDCKGDNPNELSFKKGDIVYILSREFDEKSWWIGELNGKLGLVPKTYLIPAYTLAS